MAETRIEWADKVWNPITGCTPISEGCQNCYAEKMAQRLKGRCGYFETDPFQITFHFDRFKKPWREWRKPKRIFVNSMGDLFHKEVSNFMLMKVFENMAWAEQHTFMILTKRPERMKEFCSKWVKEPLPNVWLGVTVENQQRANERIPLLLQTPATKRFISAEPILEPINLDKWLKRTCAMCGGQGRYTRICL